MKISLIIPVYNEECLIENTVKKLKEFSDSDENLWEVIIVNDGSSDNTMNILNQKIPDSFKVISYHPNRGKGYAIKKGVEQAQGDYICFTDSDLAYSFDHLIKLAEKLKSHPVVIGSRDLSTKNDKKVTFLRRILGKGFNKCLVYILGYDIGDTQCGVKGFRVDVAKDLFSKQTLYGFSFDAEILFIANKRKHPIGKISATVSDHHKKKKTKINFLKDPIKMFLDLLKIRINDKRGIYEL